MKEIIKKETKVVETPAFEANDGKIFYNKQECISYEKRLAMQGEFEKIKHLNNLDDVVPLDYYIGDCADLYAEEKHDFIWFLVKNENELCTLKAYYGLTSDTTFTRGGTESSQPSTYPACVCIEAEKAFEEEIPCGCDLFLLESSRSFAETFFKMFEDVSEPTWKTELKNYLSDCGYEPDDRNINIITNDDTIHESDLSNDGILCSWDFIDKAICNHENELSKIKTLYEMELTLCFKNGKTYNITKVSYEGNSILDLKKSLSDVVLSITKNNSNFPTEKEISISTAITLNGEYVEGDEGTLTIAKDYSSVEYEV